MLLSHPTSLLLMLFSPPNSLPSVFTEGVCLYVYLCICVRMLACVCICVCYLGYTYDICHFESSLYDLLSSALIPFSWKWCHFFLKRNSLCMRITFSYLFTCGSESRLTPQFACCEWSHTKYEWVTGMLDGMVILFSLLELLSSVSQLLGQFIFSAPVSLPALLLFVFF